MTADQDTYVCRFPRGAASYTDGRGHKICYIHTYVNTPLPQSYAQFEKGYTCQVQAFMLGDVAAAQRFSIIVSQQTSSRLQINTSSHLHT